MRVYRRALLSLFLAAVFTAGQAHALWAISSPGAFATLSDFFPAFRSVSRIINSEHTVIKFAVFGGTAELFINGKKSAETAGPLSEVSKYLKKNDVIAFKCEKRGADGGKAGLVATVTHGGSTYRTGISRFTTRGGFSKWSKWEQHRWNAAKEFIDNRSGAKHDFCHWKKADRIKTGVKSFDSKADFIWRRTGKTKKQLATTVFVRYVVGGEKCSIKASKGGDFVRNENGKGAERGDEDENDAEEDDDGSNKHKSRKKRSSGDDDDGRNSVTVDKKRKKKGSKGSDDNDDDDDKESKKKTHRNKDDEKTSETRASKDDEKDDENTGSKTKGNSGNVKSGRERGEDKDDKDDGSEEGKSVGRVPLPKDEDDEQEGKSTPHFGYGLSGQSDESKPDGFCACKLTTRTGGVCYSMKDPSVLSGACSVRACEPKFECVASSKKMCVKRHGGTKIVMVSPNNCITVTTDDMETLLPYEE